MSLYYGKLQVGVWVKLFLAKLTFIHADALSLIDQKQYAALGEKPILG